MSAFPLVSLVLTVLLIGVAATIAVQHAVAHYRPHPHEEPQPKPKETPLPPEVKQKLLLVSQDKFQAVLDKTTTDLQHDLEITAAQMNHMLQKMATEVVGAEMKRYQSELSQLRTQSEGAIEGAKSEIDKHQDELKAELAKQQAELRAKFDEELAAERDKAMQELAADKERMAKLMDARLADAVASFLMETLPHNVDLGAQSAYLTAMLEEHKTELVRGVTDGA